VDAAAGVVADEAPRVVEAAVHLLVAPQVEIESKV